MSANSEDARSARVTAALVIIGNEILSGRTADANLPFIAQTLNGWGIQLAEARVVPDIAGEIVDAVDTCRRKNAYVLTTGGIGPTHDDITAVAIARAFGRAMERNPEAERRLLAYYPPEKVNEARMKMADMPAGVILIDNPVSVAPGFIIDNVHVLPGVPKIMQAMLLELKGRLTGGVVYHSRTLVCFSPEGEMAAMLSGLQAAFTDVEIGSYPFFRVGQAGCSIVFRGTDTARLDLALEALAAQTAAAGIASERMGPAS